MRHLGFFSSFVATSAFAVFVTIFSTSAHATITSVTFDEATISNSTGIGTNTIVAYGGTAGACVASTSSTCNSCFHQPAGGTVDNALLACNERRISTNLVMRIAVVSDSNDGYPLITTSGTTTNPVPQTPTPGTVSRGSVGYINVTWAELCQDGLVANGGTGAIGSSCTIGTSGGYATGKFLVGIAAASTGTFQTSDDKTEITIVIKNGDGFGTAATFASDTDGIKSYVVYSGDKKGTLSDLTTGAGSSFPNSGFSGFSWVRVLFEKRATPNTPVWDSITAGSPHVDLEILTDTSGFSVSPVRFEAGTGMADDGVTARSVSIENDQVYDTKIAVVDTARNAMYYTRQSDNSVNCPASSLSPGSGVNECHTVRPSEVVGILSEKVNCFVATAAYGSPMANEVTAFRKFRDQFLVPTKLGKEFVRFYYKRGPIAARFIAQSETLRAISRGLLWAPLQFAKFSVAYGIFAGLSLLALLLLSPFALVIFFRRRKGSESTHA